MDKQIEGEPSNIAATTADLAKTNKIRFERTRVLSNRVSDTVIQRDEDNVVKPVLVNNIIMLTDESDVLKYDEAT